MYKPPVILITGASSGIGAATARFFGGKGYRVVMAARRYDRLRKLEQEINRKGGEALPVEADLTRSAELKNLVHKSIKAYGQLDVLVNNAGFGRITPLIDLDFELDIKPQLWINLLSPIQLTREVIPYMRARGSGHIIHVISLAGLVGAPTYSIYSASKFGLRGFNNALAREVAGWGIKVSAIYPGSVQTEFSDHMGLKHPPRATTPPALVLQPEDVARTIWQVVQKPRRTTVIPWPLIGIWMLNAHLPGLADRLIARRYNISHPGSGTGSI
jgi:short-subunit dehydrogenase